MHSLPIANDVTGLQSARTAWGRNTRIALVPTMGALHEGHLALVREARARAERVIVSIFVNPMQFAPHEDFARYPRDLERDRRSLAATEAVDLIYAPSAAEIYPEGFATSIRVDGPSAGLESDFRPHFFTGVATVVAKLFLLVRPDIALFGEKDYQQLLVVRRMARDLDLGVDVVGLPTVRESDGLALSSRNAYLSPEQRRIAAALHRALHSTAHLAQSRSIPEAEAAGAAELLSAGFDRVDYVAIRNAATLQPLRNLDRPARILAAAWLGKTRLIDNLAALP
jgi:pantoate--beta-alanine ligase